MDGFFLAKDGERAGVLAASSTQSSTGAPSRAPSQGSRLFSSAPASPGPFEPPDWTRDHEGVNEWLRSIAASDRPALLARIAANIDSIQKSPFARLEPGCEDSILSYAILIEYAVHLGLSPVDACWTFECENAEPVDALLGVRVDRMLADAKQRREMPRSQIEHARVAWQPDTGINNHWKASSSRRGPDRADNTRGPRAWTGAGAAPYHAGEPGRAG